MALNGYFRLISYTLYFVYGRGGWELDFFTGVDSCWMFSCFLVFDFCSDYMFYFSPYLLLGHNVEVMIFNLLVSIWALFGLFGFIFIYIYIYNNRYLSISTYLPI